MHKRQKAQMPHLHNGERCAWSQVGGKHEWRALEM